MLHCLDTLISRLPLCNRPIFVTYSSQDWADQTLRCMADTKACTHFDSKSDILQDFGGAGDEDCSTIHSGTVASSTKSRAKNCNGKKTHGSSAARGEDGLKGRIGCLTSGPFANWMSPKYGETKDTTATCLSRGTNWKIKSQGQLSGPISLRSIIVPNAVGCAGFEPPAPRLYCVGLEHTVHCI